MEKALEKFIRRLLLEKYPIYLDVHVAHNVTPLRRECYEVFLVLFEKDLKDTPLLYDEVYEYVVELAKYMDIRICGIYNEPVTEEEWEEMKSHK